MRALRGTFAKIVGEKYGVLETISLEGLKVRLDAFTGSLISVEKPLAAVG